MWRPKSAIWWAVTNTDVINQAEPARRMVSFTEGTVVAILPNGFRIENEDANTDCHTMARGESLGLLVGDQVRVYGGPDPKGGFTASTIHRKTHDGGSVEVLVAQQTLLRRAVSAIAASFNLRS